MGRYCPKKCCSAAAARAVSTCTLPSCPSIAGSRLDRLGHLPWRQRNRRDHHPHVNRPGRRRSSGTGKRPPSAPRKRQGSWRHGSPSSGLALTVTVIEQIAAGKSKGVPQDKTQGDQGTQIGPRSTASSTGLATRRGFATRSGPCSPGPRLTRSCMCCQRAAPSRLLVFRARVVPDATLSLQGPRAGLVRLLPGEPHLYVETEAPATRWKSWSCSPQANAV